MRSRFIVVGTDGTENSATAVGWAALEARRRRQPLRIVHTYDWDWNEARYDTGSEYIDVARAQAESVANAAYYGALELAPEVKIDTDVCRGHAAERLLETADAAELIVVGNRGRGGFAGLLLGSVSQRVATHASAPVVVVRGRHDAGGPVAVGVDDAPSAHHVLEAAFDAATRRGCALVVVRSFLPVVPLWLDKRPADVMTPAQDDTERAQLVDQLAPWRRKYPDVPVEVVLTHDGAAAALVDASTRAQLVVVGSHGRGTIRGTLLGSASLQLLHHADCPVMIVRPHRDRRA